MESTRIKLNLTILANIKATLDSIAEQAQTTWHKLNRETPEDSVISGCNETVMGIPVSVKVTQVKSRHPKCKTVFYLEGKRIARKALAMQILRSTY
jgi:hypothetical protein